MRKLKNENNLTCRDCLFPLTDENWPHWRRKVRHRLCYDCGLLRFRKRYKNYAVEIRANRRAFRKKQKEDFVKAYGGKCQCCGEKAIEFLTIAHLKNDGAKHRRKICGSSRLHTWLKKNSYPKDYGVLCFNCNTADFYYGKCPHKNSFKSSSGLEKE